MAATVGLADDVKTFVVQSLACFDTPSTVVGAVKAEFAITLTPQNVETYDPTKRSGRKLAKRWRALFEATRTTFLADTAAIGVAHRVVRLRKIDRVVSQAETRGNAAMVLQALKQAAEEVGNVYSNRRELSGPEGGPIAQQFVDRPPPVETPEEWDARVAREQAARISELAGNASGAT